MQNILNLNISKGELSEIFQWKGEIPKALPGWKEEEKEHLGEEISDVLLYLMRFLTICYTGLGIVVLKKLQLNAIKYVIHLSKGSSMKYKNNQITAFKVFQVEFGLYESNYM